MTKGKIKLKGFLSYITMCDEQPTKDKNNMWIFFRFDNKYNLHLLLLLYLHPIPPRYHALQGTAWSVVSLTYSTLCTRGAYNVPGTLHGAVDF